MCTDDNSVPPTHTYLSITAALLPHTCTLSHITTAPFPPQSITHHSLFTHAAPIGSHNMYLAHITHTTHHATTYINILSVIMVIWFIHRIITSSSFNMMITEGLTAAVMDYYPILQEHEEAEEICRYATEVALFTPIYTPLFRLYTLQVRTEDMNQSYHRIILTIVELNIQLKY